MELKAIHEEVLAVRTTKQRDTEALVKWQQQPAWENSGEALYDFQVNFLDFHLGDKVLVEGGRDDTDPKRPTITEVCVRKDKRWDAPYQTRERERENL